MSLAPQRPKTSTSQRPGAEASVMSTRQALQTLVDMRGADDLVVTTMSGAREWIKLSDHDLDLHHIPSTMSGTAPLALGLALAQPQRSVTVVLGDGSLLMSLGCLVTIIGSGATNLSVVLLDNGVYEVTGGQKTPAADCDVNFAALARATGFSNVAHFRELDDWQSQAAEVFSRPGPRFIWLEVQVETEDYLLDPPCPLHEQLTRFTEALSASDNSRQSKSSN